MGARVDSRKRMRILAHCVRACVHACARARVCACAKYGRVRRRARECACERACVNMVHNITPGVFACARRCVRARMLH